MTTRAIPGADFKLGSLPSDASEKHESFVDLLGRYVMWMRNWNQESTRRNVEAPDSQAKLGSILRRPYEEILNFSQNDRELAYKLSESSNDSLIKLLLQVLAHEGNDFPCGPDHCVRFRLVMEFVDKETGEIRHEEVVNRGGQRHFADYWGRWLNRFGDEKTPEGTEKA